MRFPTEHDVPRGTASPCPAAAVRRGRVAIHRVAARRAGRGILCVGVALFLLAPGPARALVLPLAPNTVAVGAVATYRTKAADTLLDVARRYDLGYTQLVAANRGVNAWRPGRGRRIMLPSRYILPDAPHRGIVINLAEQRLFYYLPGGRSVETFPVGIGIRLHMTPLGTTHVVAKIVDPIWIPTASERAEDPSLPTIVPAGPDNPMGDYALFLGWPEYAIHGTDEPDGIGRNVSHGCIHLYPKDIATLFRAVAVGTPVRVVDQPIEAAWIGDELYLEVHPNPAQMRRLDIYGRFTPSPPRFLAAFVVAVAGERLERIDWAAVRDAGMERSGVPVRITMPPNDRARAAARSSGAAPS